MHSFHRSFDTRQRGSVAVLVAGPVLAGLLMTVFQVAVPMIQAAENGERTNSSERSEELTIASRHERARRLAELHLHTTQFRAVMVVMNIGRTQLPDLDPSAGHRLANGLLAPMTC
jgi:hypothetical protein